MNLNDERNVCSLEESSHGEDGSADGEVGGTSELRVARGIAGGPGFHVVLFISLELLVSSLFAVSCASSSVLCPLVHGVESELVSLEMGHEDLVSLGVVSNVSR